MEAIEKMVAEIVNAAEAGETVWPSMEEFHRRFGKVPNGKQPLFDKVISDRGWMLEPFKVNDLQIIENALDTGYDMPSGTPVGYRLVRN